MTLPILIIEDNPDNLKLISWILEDEGLEIISAESAEDGFQILKHTDVELILMDISLPGINGKEATILLRQQEKYRDTPIIALTAHAIKGEDEAILASGVNELITKPIDEAIFLTCLHKYI